MFEGIIAEGVRKCHICKRKIQKGEILWIRWENDGRYSHYTNFCILCIGKEIKEYMDEFNAILKKIKIRRKNGTNNTLASKV